MSNLSFLHSDALIDFFFFSGEKVRVYTCCSRPVAESEGCVHGRHVFYETAPQDLHSRHPFSTLRDPTPSDKALDVAAMDCEMIYTTGGFRVARVSVVDGKGNPVFDELVSMDEDVHIMYASFSHFIFFWGSASDDFND